MIRTEQEIQEWHRTVSSQSSPLIPGRWYPISPISGGGRTPGPPSLGTSAHHAISIRCHVNIINIINSYHEIMLTMVGNNRMAGRECRHWRYGTNTAIRNMSHVSGTSGVTASQGAAAITGRLATSTLNGTPADRPVTSLPINAGTSQHTRHRSATITFQHVDVTVAVGMLRNILAVPHECQAGHYGNRLSMPYSASQHGQ